jgi:hypothetical protein
MNRVIGPGHILFALSAAGTAVPSLIYGDFVLQWQPFPHWIPGRKAVAYASGVAVLVASIAVIVLLIMAGVLLLLVQIK